VQSINDELEVMKAFNLKLGATQSTPDVAAMVAAINVTPMERQRDGARIIGEELEPRTGAPVVRIIGASSYDAKRDIHTIDGPAPEKLG
jgi:hypothetical protein